MVNCISALSCKIMEVTRRESEKCQISTKVAKFSKPSKNCNNALCVAVRHQLCTTAPLHHCATARP